jgi:predicted metal-binding membrane protein
MIILLVAGLMNLGLMAILTTFITLERVAPWPKGAALVAGIVAIAVAALVIARALSLA